IERCPVAHVAKDEIDRRAECQLADSRERRLLRVRQVVEEDELPASRCGERHAGMRADVAEAAGDQKRHQKLGRPLGCAVEMIGFVPGLRHGCRLGSMNVRRSPLEALLDNVNVEAMLEIPSPEEVQERLPLTDSAAETILAGRNAIRAILERKDPRLFVWGGPCSIHDPAAALDYARRLRGLAGEVRDTLVL